MLAADASAMAAAGCTALEQEGFVTMARSFEWDEQKAAVNEEKHAVSFAVAATVFGDPLAFIFDDPDHSAEELREIVMGHSHHQRLLVVSFTERKEAIRIISARKATPLERRDYEENPLGRWKNG